jgi:hypothetical protein
MASACVCDVDESASRTWTKCVTDRVVAAGGLFEIASGACTVASSATCFRSPNYPSDYAINQQCTITAREQVTLSVVVFSTETGYDNLTVNGVQYSGTSGPGGVQVVAGATITFTSDGLMASSGFEVCGASPTW